MTPNAPAHSRRGPPLPVLASADAPPPALETAPTLAPDSTTQMTYDYNSESEYRGSELSSTLGRDHQNQNQNQHPFSLTAHSSYFSNVFGYNFFPGLFHPDFLKQFNDGFPFTSDDSPEIDEEGEEEGEITKTGCHSNKRRRMSNDSTLEPPSSAASYSSFNDSSASLILNDRRPWSSRSAILVQCLKPLPIMIPHSKNLTSPPFPSPNPSDPIVLVVVMLATVNPSLRLHPSCLVTITSGCQQPLLQYKRSDGDWSFLTINLA